MDDFGKCKWKGSERKRDVVVTQKKTEIHDICSPCMEENVNLKGVTDMEVPVKE